MQCVWHGRIGAELLLVWDIPDCTGELKLCVKYVKTEENREKSLRMRMNCEKVQGLDIFFVRLLQIKLENILSSSENHLLKMA